MRRRRSPKDTTREHLDAVANGDGKRPCALMTGEFRRVTVESSALSGETPARKASSGPRACSARRGEACCVRRSSPRRAQAPAVRIRGDEGTPFRGELVTLREVDDNWKLDSQIARGG